MTTIVKVHVNGNYRATVDVTYADGRTDQQKVEPQEEKSFSIGHPADATFHVTEEYLGDKPAE